ncbi:MAG: TolC family protein [Deltaproteobacteria bacterium]|nr:TolC family protein [Deltaproteobacteria bacterium]
MRSAIPVSLLFLVTMVFLPAQPLNASAAGEKKRTLSVRECIDLAVKANPDIKAALLELKAAQAMVETAEGRFNPFLSSNLNYNRSTRRDFLTEGILDMFKPTQNNKEIFSQQGVDLKVGVNKYFSTGTSASLSFEHGWSEYETFVTRETAPGLYEPGKGYRSIWTTDLRLTLSQSLLKGLGFKANLAQIEAAESYRDQVFLARVAKVSNVLAKVTRAYWNLVLAREELKIKKNNLDLAKEQERAAKAAFEVNMVPELSVFQASAAVASREELVLLAETSVKEASSALALLLNLPTDVLIVAKDKPGKGSASLDTHDAVDMALKLNPLLKAGRQDVVRRKRLLESKMDKTLPDLSLFGTIGTTGYANIKGNQNGGDDYSDTWKDLFDQDGLNYGGGLIFTYPLGNDAAEGELERAMADYKEASVRVRQLEASTKSQVESAIRAVETARNRMVVSRKSRMFAEKRLEAEKAMFELGRNTTRDVLEAQDVLENARLSELKAKIDLERASVTFLDLTGGLLKHLDVSIK